MMVNDDNLNASGTEFYNGKIYVTGLDGKLYVYDDPSYVPPKPRPWWKFWVRR